MATVLHITSGDCAGELLKKTGLPGELLVWHDILYDGPRQPGWPDAATLEARARFIEQVTGGGLTVEQVLEVFEEQYLKLKKAADYRQIVLWFDGCLFDQSMLAHLLVLLHSLAYVSVQLLCVDAFAGIEPFDGLGQLQPDQLASLYGRRQQVTKEQFQYAVKVDRAFACQDLQLLAELAGDTAAPLSWVPAAAARWLAEQPDAQTGLGRLEQLALQAIEEGCTSPRDIFTMVAAKDTHPQYWGDTTLWAKINGLADQTPPLVRIEGPGPLLPQWKTGLDLRQFCITRLQAS